MITILDNIKIKTGEIWEFDNGKDEIKKFVVVSLNPNEILLRPYPPEQDESKDIYTLVSISKKVK